MNNVLTASTCAFALGMVLPGITAATPPRHISQLQQDADLMVARGAPGVTATIQTSTAAYSVKSGYGNITAQSPMPDDAYFRIGSFSKTFLAATMLQLVGEGQLSLEDTVAKWLPGVVEGNGNDGTNITVRQLLQHTSGIPDYIVDLPILSENGFKQHRYDSWTAQRLVALAMTHPPSFPPGKAFSYSNTDYIVAGMIVDKVTDDCWQSQIYKRIIHPLGLTQTSIPGNHVHVPHPHAIGYQAFPNAAGTSLGDFLDATLLNPTWGGAAGEIISTAADCNSFLRALINGHVLMPKQLKEMQTTVPATEFQQRWPGSTYGLGLMYIPNSCGGSWSHGGDILGYSARNGITIDGERSIMVSINTDSPKPKSDAPPPTALDSSVDLIDHALCGK